MDGLAALVQEQLKRDRFSSIERLQTIMKQLQRMQLGRRSERLDPDRARPRSGRSRQRHRARRSERSARGTVESADKQPQRKPLPDHLPREEVVIDVANDACPCCGGVLHAIGESVSEMLDWVPAELRVVRITRPKYACRACNKAIQARAPEQPIDSGLATPALLAQVLVSKYCDHIRSTGKRRSSPATASSWSARPSPAGSAARAGGSKPCMIGCARTCSRPVVCSPMTRRFRCSIRDADAPRPDACGSMPAISDRGTDRSRRRRSICSRPTERPNDLRRILSTSRECCTSSAMPGSSAWPARETSCSPPFGPTQGASSIRSRKPRCAVGTRRAASHRQALCNRSTGARTIAGATAGGATSRSQADHRRAEELA